MIKGVYNKSPICLQNVACTIAGFAKRGRRYNRTFHQTLQWLLQTDRWSLERLRDYQNKQLRELVVHCYQSVPYYARLFDENGIQPHDIQTTEDLPAIPILTKDIVRQNPDAFLSSSFARRTLVDTATSGTTGAGLRFYHSPYTIAFQWAVWWRFRMRFGVSLNDTHAAFTGKQVVPQGQNVGPYWRHNYAMHQTRFSAFHLSSATAQEYVKCLNSRHYRYYSGYPSVMSSLAEFMIDQRLELVRPPQVVFCGSESLLPHQAHLMQEAFGCPVADQYGAAEHVCNMSQCECGNYHEDMELGIVERQFVEEHSSGVSSRIIATGLTDRAFPLLRYDIGDIATFTNSPCSCDRQTPTIRCIDGRIESCILTPDGKRIGRMAHVFADLPNVRESQIVQETVYALTVKVVRAHGYSERDELRYKQRIQAIVGTEMNIAFEYVDRIPKEKNGKLRAVISRLPESNATTK